MLGKASKQIEAWSKQICWRHSKNGQMLAMTIGERRVFHLMSTIHNATMTKVHIPSEGKWDWQADAVLDYNYGMKAVDLGDKILKSYEMNWKTVLWTTKLVFHLTNMAMMNAYLLLHTSQQAAMDGIIMQEQCVKNHPLLCENLKLHNHFTFRTHVILALVEEGNQDRTFRNPCVSVLALALEWHFSECHFPKEIIPMKEGAKNYRRCNSCYTEKGVKNTKFQCGPCKIILCPWPCFAVYHTKGLMHVDAIKACNDQIAGKAAHAADADPVVDQDLPNLNMTVWLCDCSMVLFAQVQQKEIAFRTHSHFTIVCDYLGNFWPCQMTVSILMRCIKDILALSWSVRINLCNMLDIHVLCASASVRWQHGLRMRIMHRNYRLQLRAERQCQLCQCARHVARILRGLRFKTLADFAILWCLRCIL